MEAAPEVPENQSPLNFAELLPSEWVTGENRWLWIACYHAMRLKKQQLAEKLRRVDFPDAVAFLFYGSPNHLPPPTLVVQSTDVPLFAHFADPTAVAGPEGAYLILALRYQPPAETDYNARVRELTLRSLLGTVLGENIVYKRLFQNAARLDKPETTLFGGFFRNPGSYPAPDISDERLKKASDLYTAIESLEEHNRNRIQLSLRWHGDARDAEGIASFVNQWVALEALGMTAQKNVAPLEETLGRSYGISTEDAKKRFGVRLLFSFRSQILHQGHIPSIDATLLDYMRALYQDILWHRVGLPSERAAEAVLGRPAFDLQSLLRLPK